jgi:hypothetical protein
MAAESLTFLSFCCYRGLSLAYGISWPLRASSQPLCAIPSWAVVLRRETRSARHRARRRHQRGSLVRPLGGSWACCPWALNFTALENTSTYLLYELYLAPEISAMRCGTERLTEFCFLQYFFFLSKRLHKRSALYLSLDYS